MNWLVELLGLVWLTVGSVAGPVTAGSGPLSTEAFGPALDRAECEASFGTVAASACTRAILSGQFSGRELARLHNTRGNELRRIGNLDGAISDYSTAVELDPRDLYARHNRAGTWRDKGEFELAIADYSEAIRLDPLFASALVSRGLIYERKQQFDLARGDFSAVIALPPKYANTYSAQDTARERLANLWGVSPD